MSRKRAHRGVTVSVVMKMFLGIGLGHIIKLIFNAILAWHQSVGHMKTEERCGEFQIDRNAVP